MQLGFCCSFSGLGRVLIRCSRYTHVLAFLRDPLGKSRHCPSLGNVAPTQCDGLDQSPSPGSSRGQAGPRGGGLAVAPPKGAQGHREAVMEDGTEQGQVLKHQEEAPLVRMQPVFRTQGIGFIAVKFPVLRSMLSGRWL